MYYHFNEVSDTGVCSQAAGQTSRHGAGRVGGRWAACSASDPELIRITDLEENSMKPIRNSAKAIIMSDNAVLLTKCEDGNGFFYVFPGGGQERGETLEAAVIRECIEEINQQVIPQDIVAVREYIGRNHQFAETDSEVHQVEFYFECTVERFAPPENGAIPDDDQVGVEWVKLSELGEIRLYPAAMAEVLVQLNAGNRTRAYLGDVN